MSQQTTSPAGLASNVVYTSANTKTLICFVPVPMGARGDLVASVGGKNMANVAQGAKLTKEVTSYNAAGLPAVIDQSAAGTLASVGGILAATLSPFLGASISFEAMAGTNQVGLYVTPGTQLGSVTVEWFGVITGSIN